MKIQREEKWHHEASELLLPALAHDPTTRIEHLIEDVNSRDVGLFTVRQGDRIDGAFTARFDGPELVVPAVGSRSGAPLVRHVVPYLRDMAGAYECDYIRAHVPAERWEKVLARYGFKRAETVMRLGVSDGRT
ncbi:hypothetical protein QMT40_001445 [Parvibaculaceae bacterium PLY_AMNH_Bact1]|nr:hypothetical protein QMT40_001445 [Parvibaculaceae bacterium PLY_AMNH_Bact1]